MVSREHFVPLRKKDLVELLCRRQELSDQECASFRKFGRMLAALFQCEFHVFLEELKDAYSPFDPDPVTRPLFPLAPEEREKKLEELFGRFSRLMECANFRRLERKDIEEAAQVASAWGLNMVLDFSVFERLEVFVRGEDTGTRSFRHWWRLWRKKTYTLPIYRRLLVMVKLRPHKRLRDEIDTDAVYLKHFKDIPRMDVEMLLPGTRLQMPGLARLQLGGSLLSGLAYIIFKIVTEVTKIIALGLWAFWGPLAAVLGYGYKQWYGYQTTRQTYSLQLTQSLYYQNLDNNAGVLAHLVDEAEEQECREVLLAYFYLWQHASEQGWTEQELDQFIEMDLEKLAHIQVDFEIHDALAKLQRLKLVDREANRYRAVPIEKALNFLEASWSHSLKC